MYKITIERKITEKKMVRGDYEILEKRPYTKEECNAAAYGENFEKELKSIYGYGESYEKEITTEVKVFEQTVEDMDIEEVILAVNGIILGRKNV